MTLVKPPEGIFVKTWDFVPMRGEGSDPIPSCYPNFPKQNFSWKMARNVMKHIVHKWGGNIY